MATTNPSEAVAHFVELLRSTVGCVTEVPLTALPTDSDVYHIVFYPGGPVLLRTEQGTPNLKLSVVHHCQPALHPIVAGAFTVNSIYYAYEIFDGDEHEILTTIGTLQVAVTSPLRISISRQRLVRSRWLHSVSLPVRCD